MAEGLCRFRFNRLWDYHCLAGKVEKLKIELEEKDMSEYVGKTESYISRIEKQAVAIWKNIIDKDGIKMILTPEEFYKEMQEEEVRVKSIIEAGILCSPTVIDIFTPGFRNYFIINDIGNGVVCEKCGSSGVVVLLLGGDYTNNLGKMKFRPSFESYYYSGIQPEGIDFVRMFPVPINFETDYWYCPYCRELHRFTYDHRKGYGIGLEYDQKVVPVDWKPEKAEHQKGEVIELWKMFFMKDREDSNFWKMFNHGAEINPTPGQVKQARETGLPILLAKWMDVCNDPNEDCSWDGVCKYILPDGSIKIERSHMY